MIQTSKTKAYFMQQLSIANKEIKDQVENKKSPTALNKQRTKAFTERTSLNNSIISGMTLSNGFQKA